MIELISKLRKTVARATRWVLAPEDNFCLALLCLLGLGLIGGWVIVQSQPAGLSRLEASRTVPVEFRLDVNQATWPELAQLPGIGQRLAQRIVESRTVDGPFHRLADLQRVSGIGPKTIARVAKYCAEPTPPVPDEVAAR